MRISCNGCRVLRKGCADDCTIRPCLQWIHSPDSQAHATLFLAKFYGRAGLINLINAGPQQLRPAIFRSLLYEACGRIVNPIYGSVGLLWSGSWHLCQAAVESVLKGTPIIPIATETAAQGHQGPPLKAYDIRHAVKDENSLAFTDLSRIKTRKSKPRKMAKELSVPLEAAEEKVNRSTSHDSTLSHRSSFAAVDGESKESGSTVSLETAETAAGLGAEWEEGALNPDLGVGLELGLTLGFEPVAVSRGSHVAVPVKKRRRADVCACTWEENTCRVDQGLEFRAQS